MTAATAKGAARRSQVVAAAADLLLDAGPAAVTARAVASRAGVSLSALTYYFDDLGVLLREAAQSIAQRHLHAAEALLAEPPGPDPAALVVGVVAGPARTTAQVGALYERGLAAGRTPALATVLQAWDAQVVALVRRALDALGRDATHARQVLGLVDGLLVGAVLAGEADPRAVAVGGLDDVLDRLAPPRAGTAAPASAGQDQVEPGQLQQQHARGGQHHQR
jgi:DNA-binding transcriptional regulator YbjK